MDNTSRRNAVRLALLPASMLVALGVAPAFAQTTEQATARQRVTEVETRVVTGSPVRRADVNGALPAMVIDGDQIESGGDISVAGVLRAAFFNSCGAGTRRPEPAPIGQQSHPIPSSVQDETI